jgi:hypothetical protein
MEENTAVLVYSASGRNLQPSLYELRQDLREKLPRLMVACEELIPVDQTIGNQKW